MGERVATFERVSTTMSRQEIRNQSGDLRKLVEARGYAVVRRFRFAASAYHGDHDPELAAALDDVKNGAYTVIVAAMASRFERRGWKELLAYMLELDRAGGRLEAADDPAFGDLSTMMGGMNALMSGQKSRDYSDAISENTNRAFRLMDGRGAFRGHPPNGYEVTGARHARQLVPAPERRVLVRARKKRGSDEHCQVTVTLPSAAEVARAFADAATGASTVRIARRLGMTPFGVAKMLRNPVYSTGRYAVRRGDGSVYEHRCPPLVTPAAQGAAVAALDARRTGDNQASRAIAKDDFSGALYCGCGARMYRHYSGRRRNADGSPREADRRYRCGRVSCRKSVHAGRADAAVHALMSGRRVPWMALAYERAGDYAAALERVLRELRELGSRGLDDAAEDAQRGRLRAERARLEPLASGEPAARRRLVDTGRTEGQRWAELGPGNAARREWLLSGEFVMLAVPAGAGEVSVELVYCNEDDWA